MDSDIMQLGGNIELIGFSSIDKAQLYVLKKIVGNYARKLSDACKFNKFSVKLIKENEDYLISAETFGENPKKSQCKDKNLFVGLDNALKGLLD